MIGDVVTPRRSSRSLDGFPEHLKAEHLGALTRSWRRLARCLGADADLWFPIEQDGGGEAIAICRECPVRIDCLGWALDHDERQGIWGGVSARQRQQMRVRGRRRDRPSIPLFVDHGRRSYPMEP